jgi:hypothetical protein
MRKADQPIIYGDGNEARIGDRITFEHGASSGEVEDLIDSESKRQEWGVAENGIMIKAEAFGLVFCPESTILDNGISLVSR